MNDIIKQLTQMKKQQGKVAENLVDLATQNKKIRKEQKLKKVEEKKRKRH